MEETELNRKSRENILKIGFNTLSEIEEKVKSFRIMNQNAAKRRYIITRENIRDNSQKVILGCNSSSSPRVGSGSSP